MQRLLIPEKRVMTVALNAPSQLPYSADSDDTHLTSLPLERLAQRCREEIHHYNCGEYANDRYALEIFRRALNLHDAQAWAILQNCFAGIVAGWLRRHVHRSRAYTLDSEENYIAQAFTRFWQASINNPDLSFASLPAALNYLRASLNGAVLDTLRIYSRPNEVPLPEPGDTSYISELAADELEDSSELWEVVRSLLRDARERRLAYLHFCCGLKAREIIRFCPDEFNDVQEIYRLRHTIFKRLARHADQIRWRISDL